MWCEQGSILLGGWATSDEYSAQFGRAAGSGGCCGRARGNVVSKEEDLQEIQPVCSVDTGWREIGQ